MTVVEIAALIAAIAFAVLVIFVCLNLSKLSNVIKEVETTVQNVNKTLDVVTKDVDNLSLEVEGLLNKANTLVDDVNGKVGKTDPLFTAIGDLGLTVSDLNDSTRQMAANLVGNLSKKKTSKLDQLLEKSRSKFASKKSKPSEENEILQTNYENDYVSDLEVYRPEEPSTMDEIIIK